MLTSIGQAFTLLPIIIIALSNADFTRATAFAAYIQIMRLGGAEIGIALMGTWLRVREQIHSNYLGQHVENGSDNVMRMLKQLSDFFASHGTGTAPARAIGTLAALVATRGQHARLYRRLLAVLLAGDDSARLHGADHAGAAGPVHAGAVRLCQSRAAAMRRGRVVTSRHQIHARSFLPRRRVAAFNL